MCIAEFFCEIYIAWEWLNAMALYVRNDHIEQLFHFRFRGMESHILAQQQNENAATPKDIQGTDGKYTSTSRLRISAAAAFYTRFES